ncbi:phage antirepressor N-terminal domain-containing protein [Maritalea sp.]|jgi:hypothetical protein|uniref:phage antirepressor N-terminal domain-containing protein n=1 Tax=Maritalea sp. TaxID=2003361 RepID=UPI0039E248F9
MTQIQKVDFYGDSIITQLDEVGYPLVAIKPIVDRLGVDWSAQLKRLKRDPVLAPSMAMMTMETPAGVRETIALPLNLVPGFLFGIDSSRIEDEEARETVLTYQRECHEVLFKHFFGASPDMESRIHDPSAHWDWQMIAAKMGLLRETRLTFGQSAARRMWAQLGLPIMDVEEAVAPQSHDAAYVQQFVAEQMEPDRASLLPLQDAHRAYEQWAKMHNAPAVGLSAFGKYTSSLGIRKKKWGGGITHMVAIRLKEAGMTVQ